MRRLKLTVAALVLAAVALPLTAAPATADEVPCKIVIKNIYVIDLCRVLP